MFVIALVLVIVFAILAYREHRKKNEVSINIIERKPSGKAADASDKTNIDISFKAKLTNVDSTVMVLLEKMKEFLSNCQPAAPSVVSTVSIPNPGNDEDVDPSDPGVKNMLSLIPDDPQQPPNANEMKFNLKFNKSGLKFVATLEKSGDGVKVFHLNPTGEAMIIKRSSYKSDKSFAAGVVKSLKGSLANFLNGKLSDDKCINIYSAMATGKLTRGG